jgi:hypothetical protein
MKDNKKTCWSCGKIRDCYKLSKKLWQRLRTCWSCGIVVFSVAIYVLYKLVN